MGYIYFVVIVFIILVGYYIWAIFLHNPNKAPLQLEEQQDEVILFTFDEPIKVSRELVMGLPPKTDEAIEQIVEPSETSSETPESSLDGTASPSTAPSSPTVLLENRKPITAELEYLDFAKDIAKSTIQRIVSLVKNLFPSPSSRKVFEVEYNDMYEIDFAKSINEGRTMFAHIPADSLPEGKI